MSCPPCTRSLYPCTGTDAHSIAGTWLGEVSPLAGSTTMTEFVWQPSRVSCWILCRAGSGIMPPDGDADIQREYMAGCGAILVFLAV